MGYWGQKIWDMGYGHPCVIPPKNSYATPDQILIILQSIVIVTVFFSLLIIYSIIFYIGLDSRLYIGLDQIFIISSHFLFIQIFVVIFLNIYFFNRGCQLISIRFGHLLSVLYCTQMYIRIMLQNYMYLLNKIFTYYLLTTLHKTQIGHK